MLGIGSQLQIVASLSFTEIFCYVFGPIWFLKEQYYLRRNGVMPLFLLSIALVINAGISCVSNGTHSSYVLRGMAVVCMLPCVIVVVHRLLRQDMNGFKWWLVGTAISGVLCTFMFQKSVEVSMLAKGATGSAEAAADIMGGTLYWIGRGGNFINMYTQGWYMQCPTWIAVMLPTCFAVFALLTSSSGRSSALVAIGSALFVLIGGKKVVSIRNRICRNFWWLCLCGALVVLTFKIVYEQTASRGLLGEDARNKYEQQTKGGKSIKRLLLGGRMESFGGLIACVDKPIIGFGPWAMDEWGYTQRFLSEYADYEDYQNYVVAREFLLRNNLSVMSMIPCHSQIVMFWLWYGIFGLLFWLYILFVIVRYLRHDCYAVPQWFMWLAAASPAYLWNVFFSPFADRVGGMMYVVAILLVRAVKKGSQSLPREMSMEIERNG